VERFVEQALVLGTVDYGEADRVVTLFTRTRGKLSAFAAGARKSKRRFAGALEPFTLVKAQLVERNGTTFRLDSVDVERTFHGIRDELSLIARALYCTELCRELLRDAQPHEELLTLVVDYLGLLEARKAGPTSLLAFELSALALAGLMPRFDVCSLCSQDWAPRPRFDPEHGGAVCEACALRSRAGIMVEESTLASLRALQEGVRQPLPPEIRQRARELLNLFIEHQLGRRLKSVEFMRQVGLD
jgi:DNA repair protein RecO (recombination protein O)